MRIVMLQETYILANGVEIPKIGLGTWFIEEHDAARARSAPMTALAASSWDTEEI